LPIRGSMGIAMFPISGAKTVLSEFGSGTNGKKGKERNYLLIKLLD